VNMGLAGTFVDDGGAVIVPTGGDGSKAWVMQPQFHLSSKQYGARHDAVVDEYGRFVSGTDDTAAIQKLFYASPTLGIKSLYPMPASFTNLLMPDWNVTGKYWSGDGTFMLTGQQGLSVLVQRPEATSGYGIKHPHIDTTTSPRGQHDGILVENITLVGGCGLSKAMHGWGFENTTRLRMRGCKTYAFPRGAGVHLYAHQNGGMYGPELHGNVWGYQTTTAISGSSFVDLTLMRSLALEVGVWLDGPYDTTGKCNDVVIDDRILDCRVTGIYVRGHGVRGTAGCSYNVRVTNSMSVEQDFKKVEEGLLVSAADASHVVIRADAPAANRIAGLYVNCVFATLDANGYVVDWQVITADDGAGALTLKGNLASGVPAGGLKYRISDAAVWDVATEDEFNPTKANFNYFALYSSIYWGTPDGQLRWYVYTEETFAGVVAPSWASVDVLIECVAVVSEGWAWRTLDGSDGWRPKQARFTSALGGPNGVVAETHMTGHIWNGDGQSDGNTFGLIGSRTNNTGGARQPGEAVRFGSGYQLAQPSTTGLHYPVVSRGRVPTGGFAPGKKMPIMMHGFQPIQLDLDASGGAVSIDWAVVQISGSNNFKAVNPTSLTNYFTVVGRVAAPYSGTGVVSARAFIGPIGT
ncbi:MAG: hypothetical protein QM651_17930, partial [Rhodoblastus sp.]